MIVLGIESTAHTFGVGIVKDGEIIANEKDTYKPEEGGIIPREAMDHHYDVAPIVIGNALKRAGIKLEDVDIIAYSQGPGIPSCLRVGYEISKYISLKYNKKLIGVNHCIAHLEIARKLTGFEDPAMLYVSGGNTQIIVFREGRYRVFGETQDIGVGNLLDRVGRLMGIPFPAGPKIEELAKKGSKYIRMPYVVKGMDVSFSGIETFVKGIIGKEKPEDIAYSLQETVFSMLIEATERAMAFCNKDSLVITGGVAANKRLNEMAKIMCEERGAKFNPIPMEYANDNGAMIAYTGYLMREYHQENLKPIRNYRTDVVDILYR